MYYIPMTYPYPYYAYMNPPAYNSGFMSRNSEENEQHVLEAVHAGIKREASTIGLYQRLADIAPNEQHKHDILLALDENKGQLDQFTNLYRTLTGRDPEYQTDEVPFDSYEEGLEKAYEREVEGYEEYRNNSMLTQHPVIQNVFLHAVHGEEENATRLRSLNDESLDRVTDYGSQPFVVNIEEVTQQNDTFRTALWTGDHLQVTLMSIDVGEGIGLETHPHLDQFLRIEQGQGLVQMGDSEDQLDFQTDAYEDFVIIVPAGKWHNLTNTGNTPLKLYSIYAPPEHPYGTVHETKEIAMAAEEHDQNI